MGENEWWGVGLGGGTRGPHKNADFTLFFFIIFFLKNKKTDGMLQSSLLKKISSSKFYVP